jgi:hypothetical protein
MKNKKLDSEINSQKYFKQKNTSTLVSRVLERCNALWESARECLHFGCRGRASVGLSEIKKLAQK